MKILASIATWLFLAVGAVANPCGTADLFDTLSTAERAAIQATEARTSFSTGVLWQGNKGDDVVTVIGTIHIPDPRLNAMVERISGRLQDAEALVIEATQEDELKIAALAVEEPELFFLMEGPSLIDLLGPEDWALAVRRFEDAGVPSFMGAKFRPWYAAMVMGLPTCVTQSMATGEPGLDRRLERIAEAAGVSVVAIEDGIEVIRSLMGDSDSEDIEDLRFSLRADLSGRDVMSTTIEAYFDGRTAAIWELGRIVSERFMPGEGAQQYDEFSDLMLHDRNRAWEADLPKLVTGRDVVIAVGAAHLPGETGVLRALERLGYEITPLP